MPTSHPTATRLSLQLSRLAIEAQQLADQLAAEPLDEYEVELQLGQPSFLLAKAVEQLEGAIFSAVYEDPVHRADDLEIARIIADAQQRQQLAID